MIKVFLNVALRISNLITAYALITNSVLADWQTDDQKINIVSRDDANAQYAIGLLKLAISKLEKPYNVNVTHGELTAMRLKESVKSGSIDVIWTATNNDLENELIPVRVPLDKGLLGYRIFILHKDNKRLLDNVNTIDELRRFTMGQGRGWSDADILRSNGFNVILAPKYEGLFHMIDGKRFQLFPRGVNEPFSEIEKRPDLDLSIDDNIMKTGLACSGHEKKRCGTSARTTGKVAPEVIGQWTRYAMHMVAKLFAAIPAITTCSPPR